MIFLTEKSVRQNMKRFGYKSYDAEVVQVINTYLEKFVHSKLEKTLKKNKNISSIEASHVHKGGRIVLPSEYFGVPSGSYFDKLTDNGANMSVTEALIRPTIPTRDLSGAITGGATKFSLSKKAFSQAVEEAKLSMHKDVKVKKEASSVMQNQFEELMTALLHKTQKSTKSEHLSAHTVKNVASQKKYNGLHG